MEIFHSEKGAKQQQLGNSGFALVSNYCLSPIASCLPFHV